MAALSVPALRPRRAAGSQCTSCSGPWLERAALARRNTVLVTVAVLSLVILLAAAVVAGNVLTSSLYRAAEENAGEDAQLIADQGLAAVLSDGTIDNRDLRIAAGQFAAARRSHALTGLVVWTPDGRILFAMGDGRRERTGAQPDVVRAALAAGRTRTAYGEGSAVAPAIEAAVPVRAHAQRMVAEFDFSRDEVDKVVRPAKHQLEMLVVVAALLLYLAIMPLLARLMRRLPPPLAPAAGRAHARVREALDEDRVRVHYQPQVCLATGTVLGAEALVRIEDPDRGIVRPGEFLPAIEHCPALFARLNAAIVDQAVGDCARWVRAGHRLPVAINVAANSLGDGCLQAALDRHGLDPSLVTIEVTESTIMSDDERQLDELRELRALGIRVSIDDFGTGYSSLARLRRLPLDELKIDQSFVSEIAGDVQACAVVQMTIDLARELGLAVVAEGVEDEATAETLTAMGCSVAQGFLFSRPVTRRALLERAALVCV